MKAIIIAFNKKQTEIESTSMHDFRVAIVTWFSESDINLTDKELYNADKDLFLAITGREDACMVAGAVVNFTY